MGLDYSFEIYVPRVRARSLLAAVNQISEPSGELPPTTVHFGDGVEALTMACTSRWEGGRHVCFGATGDVTEPFELELSLWFVADDVVLAYGSDLKPAVRDSDGVLRRSIGLIYLSVEEAPGLGDDLRLVRFTAATSSMSRLFEASTSVKARFARLARDAGAELCLLDLEDDWPIAIAVGAVSLQR